MGCGTSSQQVAVSASCERKGSTNLPEKYTSDTDNGKDKASPVSVHEDTYDQSQRNVPPVTKSRSSANGERSDQVQTVEMPPPADSRISNNFKRSIQSVTESRTSVNGEHSDSIQKVDSPLVETIGRSESFKGSTLSVTKSRTSVNRERSDQIQTADSPLVENTARSESFKGSIPSVTKSRTSVNGENSDRIHTADSPLVENIGRSESFKGSIPFVTKSRTSVNGENLDRIHTADSPLVENIGRSESFKGSIPFVTKSRTSVNGENSDRIHTADSPLVENIARSECFKGSIPSVTKSRTSVNGERSDQIQTADSPFECSPSVENSGISDSFKRSTPTLSKSKLSVNGECSDQIPKADSSLVSAASVEICALEDKSMLPKVEPLNWKPSSASLPAKVCGTEDPNQNNHANEITFHNVETTSVDQGNNLDNRKQTLAPDVEDGICLSFSSTSPCLSLEKANSLASIKEDTDINAHDGKGTPENDHHEVNTKGCSSSNSETYLEFDGTSPTSCDGALDIDQTRERENGSNTCTITKTISQESIELAATLGREILDDATATAMDLFQKLKIGEGLMSDSKDQHRELCNRGSIPNLKDPVQMFKDVEDKREEYDYTPDFEDSQDDEQSISDIQNTVELTEARLRDAEDTLEDKKMVGDSEADIVNNIQEDQQSNATDESTAIERNQTARSKSLENLTEENLEENGTVTDLENNISISSPGRNESSMDKQGTPRSESLENVSGQTFEKNETEDATEYYGKQESDVSNEILQKDEGSGEIDLSGNLAQASEDVFGSSVEADGAFSSEEHLNNVSMEERQNSANPSPSVENFVNAALEDQGNYLTIEHQGILNENQEDPPLCRSDGNSTDEVETGSSINPVKDGEPHEESDRECEENHQNANKCLVPTPSEPDGSFEGREVTIDKEDTEPNSAVFKTSAEDEGKSLVPQPVKPDGSLEESVVTIDKEDTAPNSAVSKTIAEEEDKSLVPKPSKPEGSFEKTSVTFDKEGTEPNSAVFKTSAEEEDKSLVPKPSKPEGSFEKTSVTFDKEGTEPNSAVFKTSAEEEDKSLVPKPSKPEGSFEKSAVTIDNEGTEPNSAVSKLSAEEEDKSLDPKPSEPGGSFEGREVTFDKVDTDPNSAVFNTSVDGEEKSLVPTPSEPDGSFEESAVTIDKDSADSSSAVPKLNAEEEDGSSPFEDDKNSNFTPKHEGSHSQRSDQEHSEETHSAIEPNETATQNLDEKPQQEVTGLRDTIAESRFSSAIRFACRRLPPEDISKLALPGITAVHFCRVISGLNLRQLLGRLVSLTELDLSGNEMGPQAFRVVVLGMRRNTTLKSLNLANNGGDTDSSNCLGLMLSDNSTLECLDVSGNNLGKDYFSRCVGPALLKNSSLKSLKCSSCGVNDVTAMMTSLSDASSVTTLTQLDVSHNQLQEKEGEHIAEVMKKTNCSLRVLNIQNTRVTAQGMQLLLDSLKCNKSLEKLKAGGNEVFSVGFLLEFIFFAASHSSLVVLNMEGTKCLDTTEDWNKDSGAILPNVVSKMKVLKISGCSLTDRAVESLAVNLAGRLVNLNELDVSANEMLTAAVLKNFTKMMIKAGTDDGFPLCSLDFALNNAEDLPALISNEGHLATLTCLSLRKSKISPSQVGQLRDFVLKNNEVSSQVSKSLNLDGVKLSGSDALQSMLGLSELFIPTKHCSLSSLSLSGCGLNDKDVRPLLVSIGNGLGLEELKLSVNRLTDSSVISLVDSISVQCSLQILNFSNNKIRNSGAEKLANSLQDKFPNLQKLFLSNNCIGAKGLESLVTKLGPGCNLVNLELKNQQQAVDEDDLDKILQHLVERFENGDCSYTNVLEFPTNFILNLTGLGGEPGKLGQEIDSLAIQTDYSRKHRRTLGLDDALQLSAALSNSSGEQLSISQEDWNRIIGSGKNAPTWLQVSSHRCRAVYVTNLPLTVTTEKLHGQLDSDAECNVEEVYLGKDEILRKPNGLAWVLFEDEASVTKSLEYYNSGQALMYGRPFVISDIRVEVTSELSGDADAQTKAQLEIQDRETKRRAEQAANEALVQSSYEESKARHEYAAQHPAYADGRVW